MVKILLAFLLLNCMSPLGTIHAKDLTQGQIIGAFIYRISQFVTWPENAFKDSSSSFQICIFGKDELNISQILDQEIGTTRIHGKKIEIVSLPTLQSAIDYFEKGGTSQLLYMTGHSLSSLSKLENLFEKESTLFMGESMAFLDAGGMLSFVQRKGKLRLFMNRDLVEQSALKFDSRLMLLVRNK